MPQAGWLLELLLPLPAIAHWSFDHGPNPYPAVGTQLPLHSTPIHTLIPLRPLPQAWSPHAPLPADLAGPGHPRCCGWWSRQHLHLHNTVGPNW